ncbi:MAG: sulfite exporter TauE/SafE family protein [bacterium]|nr:MAG: sulfite exporter TauE/SafE family protein [bacterium]
MQIAYLVLLTFIASGIGTLTGFGTSTVMVPVLLSFLPLPQTLLLVGIIHWFGDIWKMALFRQGIRWKLILGFGIAGMITTFVGARIVTLKYDPLFTRILGGFLVGYVVFLYFKPAFKIRSSNSAAVTGGGLSGFFAGIFGIGGAIRSAFLSAFDLPKAVYIATTGAIAFIIDSTRLVTYFTSGVRLPRELTWGLMLFVPVSFLGARTAKHVVNRIPQDRFRIVVAIFLLLVGLKLLLFNV